MRKYANFISFCFIMLVVLLSLGACSNSKLAPFINPTDVSDNSSTNDRYIINVTSSGGLPLNGVKVTASKNGAVVKSGISVNGKVEFAIPLDKYNLDFSSLPSGYYIEDGQTFTTSDENYSFNAVFPSKVIENASKSGGYVLGDVMHDFRFTDTDGNAMWLSDLVETNKAVILNFWYRSCAPCRAEFPALENAYKDYSEKIKILAISNQDNEDSIRTFKKSGVTVPLTFSMGVDGAGITNLFGVNSFPTTVVIDRYGVVAYMHSGSITNEAEWKALFEAYTSNDYVQTPSKDEGGSSDQDDTNRVKPNVSMPSANDIAVAIADIESFEGRNLSFHAEEDDEYAWPWLINSETGCVYNSNINVDNSYSILYVEFDAEYNDRLIFNYSTSCEDDDILYVIYNGELATEFTGENNSGTYDKLTFTQSERAVVAFVYQKDLADMLGKDTVTISNLRLTVVDDVIGTADVRRDVARKPNETKTAYTEFNDDSITLGEDGYYYIVNDKGVKTLLYTDLISPTQWTRLRFGTDIMGTHPNLSSGEKYERGVWPIIYWHINNSLSEQVILNGNDYTKFLHELYNANTLSGSYTADLKGYIPVDEKLRAMLTDFAFEFFNKSGKAEPNNETTWLEFCCYFDHFGADHPQTEDCWVTDNPTLGMTFEHPLEMPILASKPDIEVGTVVSQGVAVNRFIFAVERGVRYRFVAPKSGVYAFRSLVNSDATDSLILIYDDQRNCIVENDECRDYDRFDVSEINDSAFKYFYDFGAYVYLEEGEIVYPILAMSQPMQTGEYPYSVTYEGETATKLLVCTTGEGAYSYKEDTGEPIFLAEEVAFNEDQNCYFHVINSDEAGRVYIDFCRSNFFERSGKSIYDMITMGAFDFSSNMNVPSDKRRNYTNEMLEYYQLSIENKQKGDLMYGLIPASKTLTDILDVLVYEWQETSGRERAWRQFACFEMYYGPEA